MESVRGMKTYRSTGLLLFLCSSVAFGQNTGSTIRGAVADPSGAAIGAARIEITDVETGIQRVVPSSPSGEFELPDLPSGVYRLSATSPGFKTFVAENILLESS